MGVSHPQYKLERDPAPSPPRSRNYEADRPLEGETGLPPSHDGHAPSSIPPRISWRSQSAPLCLFRTEVRDCVFNLHYSGIASSLPMLPVTHHRSNEPLAQLRGSLRPHRHISLGSSANVSGRESNPLTFPGAARNALTVELHRHVQII